MSDQFQVMIRGEYGTDDGLRIDLPRTEPDQAWWTIPLPPCPDCGGDLVWYEAGYVPGTRKCMGQPIGEKDGQPTYDEDGGCGSMFSVDADGTPGVFLQRERFYN